MLFFDFYDWTNRIIQRLSCGILHNIWLTYPSKKKFKKTHTNFIECILDNYCELEGIRSHECFKRSAA